MSFSRWLLFASFLLTCTNSYGQNNALIADTVTLNHQKLLRTSADGKFSYLTTLTGDTVLKNPGYYSDVKFIDINEDGYRDIRAFVFSNTPNQCDNFLFDKNKKTFRQIEDCDLDIQLIKGTPYYFSYNRTGCSDMNWESYLGRIENFRLVQVGHIDGTGCEGEEQRWIEIYKLHPSSETETLVKKLPYDKYISGNTDKWTFIKTYWSKNWRLFK